MNFLRFVFQDWAVNKGNIKARIVLPLFRLANYGAKVRSPWIYLFYPYVVFYRFFCEWLLGIELPWRLSVGSSLRLYHGQSLVVNDRAVIGDNCVIRHSTTIGVAGTASDYSGNAPVIGDNVDIGAHVVIIGGVKVGSNSVIAAGSIVIKDVPPWSTVVGNPGRVVKTNDDV